MDVRNGFLLVLWNRAVPKPLDTLTRSLRTTCGIHNAVFPAKHVVGRIRARFRETSIALGRLVATFYVGVCQLLQRRLCSRSDRYVQPRY